MKNKIIFVIIMVVMILLIASANFVLKDQEILNDEQENQSSVGFVDNIDEVEKEENLIDSENKIMQITEAQFEMEVLQSEKIVMVDFYADWCGPCKQMNPIIEKIAKENDEIKIVKINVDEEENLAMNYEVYSIPTFVIIKNGEVKERMVGMKTEHFILDVIKNIK